MKQLILHVDINSYFATLLQQKYPHLRGRPVGIVKDVGRTCIIAASKEAKLLGIATGSSVADAKKLAPHLILQPAEFEYYLDCTKRLKNLFAGLVPDIEIFSLDEAFLPLTACRRYLYPDPFQFAQIVQSQIRSSLGEWVTCNVGISTNRFLAKLASEVSPKGSITQINRHNRDLYLGNASFKDTCGVGLRLEKKLVQLNVFHPYQLNFIPDTDLERHFGPFWSVQLRRIGQGEEPHLFRFIDHLPHMKSVGRSITGFRLHHQEAEIKAVLYNLVSEVIHKVRRMGLAGRQVSITLYGREQAWHRHLTLKHYLCHSQEMFHYLYHHLYRSWHRPFPILKFAVRLSLLQPLTRIPLSLLPGWQKQERLHQALDRLAAKFGLYAVHSGLLANREIIYPEVTGFFGDRKFHLA